ncbi:hypothetical protein VNO80_25262 [Phaseolus coccineus]|uniref:Uncharacterized protein n=1 Tax=Phaseolus coccineus TaxID=3886 RepID=A0AAN9LUF9_PHACN
MSSSSSSSSFVYYFSSSGDSPLVNRDIDPIGIGSSSSPSDFDFVAISLRLVKALGLKGKQKSSTQNVIEVPLLSQLRGIGKANFPSSLIPSTPRCSVE